jgi:hypothetical protein
MAWAYCGIFLCGAILPPWQSLAAALARTAYRRLIRFRLRGLHIVRCDRAIQSQHTISRCPASIGVIYVATDIGYVSRHKLAMKMLASSFGASRPVSLIVPLATSGGAVHADPMTEVSNGGYDQAKDRKPPFSNPPTCRQPRLLSASRNPTGSYRPTCGRGLIVGLFCYALPPPFRPALTLRKRMSGK